MEAVIVKASQLGNCWSPHRFCGGRCLRVMGCTYPEKVDCKAVQSEIDHLDKFYTAKIRELQEQLKKALETLNNKKERLTD